MITVRHGDVPIHQLAEIPATAEKVEHNGKFTLAWGEVTGHHHTLYAKKKDDMDIYKIGETFFINLKVDVPLRHQEHKEIVIPAGIYGVGMETEYDPYLKRLTRVID